MEYLSENHQYIKELAQKRYEYEEKDVFFEKSFPNYDIYDQATILSFFHVNLLLFFRYINGSFSKDELDQVFKDSVTQFAHKKIDYNDISLFPILLTYFNLDYVPYDKELFNDVFHRIEELYRVMDLGVDSRFEEVLASHVKNIVYASSDKEEYHLMTKSNAYHSFEKIVCKYIKSMSDDEAISSDFLQLLIETSSQLPSIKILETIHEKLKDKVSFDKFQSYIDSDEKVPSNLEQEFIRCVRKYRLQNKILPIDVCYYINRVYSDSMELLRFGNIDLIKYYLKKKGIEDAAVLYDEYISRFNSKGIALPTVLALKDVSLSPVMFHEATHLIQYRNFTRELDFSGNKYDMLKDFILKDYIAQIVYNRNHNRYLFEIEADYYGELEYYSILEKISGLNERDLLRKDKLMDNQLFRFSLAHYLNIDGKDYEKGQLFDEVILEHPEIISKYPILSVEYHKNGSRKGVIQILESLDNEASSRREDEITAIANCIFGEYYVVDDAVEMLSMLKQYVPNHSSLIETEKHLIDKLLSLIGIHKNTDDGFYKK